MDNPELLTQILYIVGCILLIGFFAGIEIAFISVNKLNIELRKKQGTLTGRILAHFMENPAEFIGTSLVGVNVLLVIYGLNMTEITYKLILQHLPYPFNSEYFHLFADTLIATAVILFFAEFLPKAIFRSKAERLLAFFSIPMQLLYIILYPVAKVFVALSEFILKYLFNVRISEKKQIFNRVDLEHFVKQTMHGQDDNTELNTELFENALYLVNVKIRKCMVPRNEVQAIEISTPIHEVSEKFIETKLSKIIVYKESIDNIVGYIHHLDLNRQPKKVQEVLHNITAVPETLSAVDLMNRFTKDRKSIAWVVDEFGGTAGIVTMEDVLEEIFGDINDEFDTEEYVEEQLSKNEYLFSGRLELDYLNEKYNLNFNTEDIETLSGYIIAKHEAIPNPKERIVIEHFEFDVLRVSDTRIETVKMKILN